MLCFQEHVDCIRIVIRVNVFQRLHKDLCVSLVDIEGFIRKLQTNVLFRSGVNVEWIFEILLEKDSANASVGNPDKFGQMLEPISSYHRPPIHPRDDKVLKGR